MPPKPDPPQPTTAGPATDRVPEPGQVPLLIEESSQHSRQKAIILAVVYFLYAAISLGIGMLAMIICISQDVALGDRQYAYGCGLVNLTGVWVMIFGGVRVLLRWEMPSAVGVWCLIVGAVNVVICFKALRTPGPRPELLTLLAWGGLVVWGGFAFLNFDLSSRRHLDPATQRPGPRSSPVRRPGV